MSVSIQISALSPLPAAPKVPAAGAVFAKAVGAIRAAFVDALMPSYAERHAKPVDILSASHPHGYGRDSLGWNDIGYRI